MQTDDLPTLLRDLRQLVDSDDRDERLRSELRALLLDRARQRPVRERRGRWHVQPRLSLAVGVAGAAIATVVAVFGLAGTAGEASAEAVLRHAAAVRFAPEQAVHLDYSVQMTRDGRTSTGTGDVWVETDANGSPTLVAETLSLRKLPSAPAQLVERDIETPFGVYTYDASQNAIEIPSLPPQSPSVPLPAFLFNGATVAQRLQQLGADAQGGARLLGQRTIDGVTVDAIQVDGWPNGGSLRTIFYFDAQSHVLRGFDVTNSEPSDHAAVAAGQITQAQAAQAIASQQTQLRAFVTGSRPAADTGKAGTATTSSPANDTYTQALTTAARALQANAGHASSVPIVDFN